MLLIAEFEGALTAQPGKVCDGKVFTTSAIVMVHVNSLIPVPSIIVTLGYEHLNKMERFCCPSRNCPEAVQIVTVSTS